MKLQEFKLDLIKRGFNVFESYNPIDGGVVEVVLFKFDTDNLRFEHRYHFTFETFVNNTIYIGYLKEGAAKIEKYMSDRHINNPDTCQHSIKRLDEVNNVCEFCMGKIGSTLPMPDFNLN